MEKRREADDANASKLAKALMELGSKIGNSLGGSGERATEVPGLVLYRCTGPTVPIHASMSRAVFLSRKRESEWIRHRGRTDTASLSASRLLFSRSCKPRRKRRPGSPRAIKPRSPEMRGSRIAS
jgi:hypothetical protein